MPLPVSSSTRTPLLEAIHRWTTRPPLILLLLILLLPTLVTVSLILLVAILVEILLTAAELLIQLPRQIRLLMPRPTR